MPRIVIENVRFSPALSLPSPIVMRNEKHGLFHWRSSCTMHHVGLSNFMRRGAPAGAAISSVSQVALPKCVTLYFCGSFTVLSPKTTFPAEVLEAYCSQGSVHARQNPFPSKSFTAVNAHVKCATGSFVAASRRRSYVTFPRTTGDSSLPTIRKVRVQGPSAPPFSSFHPPKARQRPQLASNNLGSKWQPELETKENPPPFEAARSAVVAQHSPDGMARSIERMHFFMSFSPLYFTFPMFVTAFYHNRAKARIHESVLHYDFVRN